MRKENLFLGIVTVVVMGLILIKPNLSWQLGRVLNYGQSVDQNAVILENQVLKSLVAESKVIDSLLKKHSDYIPAAVYSRYPFEFRDELLIDVGGSDGVEEGKEVILPVDSYSRGILLGKIKKVFSRTSIISTIFDDGWRSSVRIGDSPGVDALLIGGSEPILSFIDKEVDLKEGDIVYVVDPGFTYALPVGEIGDFYETSDKLFKEAVLNVGYNPSNIRGVLVINN